jgi:hypothetical protein
MFVSPEINMYATAAGGIDRASEMFEMIAANLTVIPVASRTYGDCVRSIAAGCFLYKKERFTLDVLPKYRLPPQDFDPKKVLTPDLDAKLQAEWREYYVGCDLLIGWFDNNGRAYLFSVDGQEGTVTNQSFPGFDAIGVTDQAMFWLSYRQQVMGMGLRRAAYHAYEAKLLADKSAHVNEHIDMLIAGNTEHWFVSTHRPEMGKGSPVSLADLKGWFEKYGPRETSGLDGVAP